MISMGSPIKIMYYDCETTGTDERKHGIHQISGCIEIDNVVQEWFDYKVAPNPKAAIVPEALAVSKVTAEQVQAYEPMDVIYRRMTAMLAKYVDRYDKSDKIYLCGFNSADFDNRFLRAWFKQNGDQYFGAYFYGEDLDVRILAAQYLLKRRARMENFKLMSVARELGIEVDESKLHDALYDIELTRACYRIVTSIDYEL
jgi:DNA polymerase-3 subunit epsilon